MAMADGGGGPSWLPGFLAPASSNPDGGGGGGNRYGIRCYCGTTIMLFCIDCGEVCCPKHHPGGHRTLRVVKASRQMSIKQRIIGKLVDVSDIHPYHFNGESVVFLDRPARRRRAAAGRNCAACGRAMRMIDHRSSKRDAAVVATIKAAIDKGKFKFCSIGCKVRHVRDNPGDGSYTLSPLGGSGGLRPRSPVASAGSGSESDTERCMIEFERRPIRSGESDSASEGDRGELIALRLGSPCYHDRRGGAESVSPRPSEGEDELTALRLGSPC